MATRKRRVILGWSSVRGAWVAALTAAAGLAFLASPIGDPFEAYGRDTLFYLRGAMAQPPNIAVVAIDKNATDILGLPGAPACWPREVHIPLIESLVSRGAAVIVFDLTFAKERSESDQAFADAIRDSDRVVLLRYEQDRKVVSSPSANGQANVHEESGPLQKLTNSALAVAPSPISFPLASRFWTFFGEDESPTLPSVALQLTARDIAADWAGILAIEEGIPHDPQAWKDGRIAASMSLLHKHLRTMPDAARRLQTAIETLGMRDADKAKRLSALLNLYTGADIRLLNFRGPPETILTIRLNSLITTARAIDADARGSSIISKEATKEGEQTCPVSLDGLDPEPLKGTPGDLEGKIVFVGVTDLTGTSPDSHSITPLRKLSGVEILATGLADLMENNSLQRSDLARILIPLGVALVMGVGAATGSIWMLVGTFAFLPLAVWGLGYCLFVWANIEIPVFAPTVVEYPIGALLCIGVLWRTEGKQRRSIERALRQWLPSEIADVLAGAPLSAFAVPAGETHFAICLATDAEGFTAVSEKLAAEALEALMKEYFGPLFAAVQRHGGAISNVSGDALMCAWKTVPGAVEARANALAATLEMSEAVETFNERHRHSPLPTRFGLNAGHAVFGAVGGSGHYVAILLGDVANAASRIESLNNHLKTRILASEDVLSGLDAFIVRPLGAFIFKGKSQSVRVAEILGRRGETSPKAALAESFAVALEAYDAERWDEAATRLHELQAAYPDDGPTAFFLNRAILYSRNPPPPLSERPIRMNVK